MQSEAKKISLTKQLLTCALLCTIAFFVIIFFHQPPYLATLLAGLPLMHQFLLGIGIGIVYWASAAIGQRYMVRQQSVKHLIQSYSRLDLRGYNWLWIALAAGVGEELLFRGALQPLLGIWLTSVLFVLVHIRGYQFNTINRRVLIQALCLFAISVVFGYIARYAGLITAMLVHAAVDIVGLYAIRRLTLQAEAAALLTPSKSNTD
jgi:uncharacterized protein